MNKFEPKHVETAGIRKDKTGISTHRPRNMTSNNFSLYCKVYIKWLGSVSVRCYGTTKSFVLKTHGSHDKITILLN